MGVDLLQHSELSAALACCVLHEVAEPFSKIEDNLVVTLISPLLDKSSGPGVKRSMGLMCGREAGIWRVTRFVGSKSLRKDSMSSLWQDEDGEIHKQESMDLMPTWYAEGPVLANPGSGTGEEALLKDKEAVPPALGPRR